MERHTDMHPFPNTAAWQAAAQRLREAAREQNDAVKQQTLMTLAADCDMLASERKAAPQPGRPRPPGNPPQPSDRDRPPVEEPPRPVPPPRPQPPPPPLQTRK
jgi:hypothetical protein